MDLNYLIPGTDEDDIGAQNESRNKSSGGVVEPYRSPLLCSTPTTGFQDVDEDDVINLLEFHKETFSNEDIVELDREKALSSEDEEKEPEMRLLEVKDLRVAFKLIDEGLKIFKDKDPNPAGNDTVCNNVLKEL
ncbi:hypothetical protein E2C01_046316 [Portunus trituberculatus]|uniref:Uncharacterized protein n=1 Tax=Portunus trituberculatus TaxID=210409 RepID=A0A5B7G5P2_PORTR|nr:hypothetical protein [Portunus trituberculatus]